MKTKRFFSLFFILTLVVSLWATPQAAAVEDPDIQAKAALLVDVNTDSVVYAKNEHQELYPASLTKVMTTLLVLDAVEDGKLRLDQELTASESAFIGLAADGSNAGIKPGEIMTVENLLYCMMVVSANEACNILAEAVSGSVAAFVDEMNTKAKELGCDNTHFANTNGLHDPQHYTSAWDMYLITKAAMEHDLFLTISDTANVVIPATNLSKERNYWTTNHLLSTWRVIGYRNKEAHGIKTGSTDEAGYCLISSAARGSMHCVSVIMGAERVEENGKGNIRSFSETTRMFNYGFENFSFQTILEPSTEVTTEIAVTLSKVDHVTVAPNEEVEVLFPNDLDPADLQRAVHVEEPVEAPIQQGQKLGTMDLYYGDTVYATVDLLALHDVESSRLLIFWRDVQEFFEKPILRIISLVLLALIVLLVLLKLLFGRRRHRYGRSTTRRRGGGYRGRRRR